ARTIVTVAGKIGIRTVAEYVHDRQTAELAREIGIDYLQGFHLGEPRPRDMMPEEGTGIDG
ncbi:MAG TPA: EAL domain-containing protein, partial [Desulfobulbus sp.]|nr:EAL domain-containing protein [Desulfobulbus sp.]